MIVDKFEVVKNKIITDVNSVEFERMLAYWRFRKDKIIFTNGCFDIVHRGHVEYLAKASNLGDVLIVGLNSDTSVSRLKGSCRPLLDEYSRAMILAVMRFVEKVIIFEEDTPYNLIKKIQPDILVKGGDYDEETIVGADIVKAKGGKVVRIDFVEGYSTSSIVEKIKKEC